MKGEYELCWRTRHNCLQKSTVVARRHPDVDKGNDELMLRMISKTKNINSYNFPRYRNKEIDRHAMTFRI